MGGYHFSCNVVEQTMTYKKKVYNQWLHFPFSPSVGFSVSNIFQEKQKTHNNTSRSQRRLHLLKIQIICVRQCWIFTNICLCCSLNALQGCSWESGVEHVVFMEWLLTKCPLPQRRWSPGTMSQVERESEVVLLVIFQFTASVVFFHSSVQKSTLVHKLASVE